MKLKDKVAIITGAGSGMGKASALLFAKEGATVVIADLNIDNATNVANEIIHNGGIAKAASCDVSDKQAVTNLINETVNDFGKIDILYNNAGYPMSFVPTEEVTEDLVERLINVNLKGVYWGVQAVIPHMKKQKSGVILNTASINATRPRAGNSMYSASKAATVNLTKSLALELAEFGIRVVGINPVATETPMLADFIGRDNEYNSGKQKYESTIPLGRVAKPEDIANAALFLVSNEAAMVTGSFIDVDGGRGV